MTTNNTIRFTPAQLRHRVSRLTTAQRNQLADRLLPRDSSREELRVWLTADRQITHAELHAWVMERLPAAWRPRTFQQTDTLPHTSTGKIDRRRLSSLERSPLAAEPAQQPEDEGVLPAGDTDHLIRQIRTIWRQVFKTEVSDTETFVDAGGDSMDVIRVLALMSDAGLRMTPSQFAEHATIRAQAALLQREPSLSAPFPSAPFPSAPFGSAPFGSAPASPAPVAALPPTSLPDAMVADADHTAPATKSVPAASQRGHLISLNTHTTRPVLFFLPPKCRAARSFEHIAAHINHYCCVSPVLVTDDTEDTSVVEDVVPEMLALVKRRQPRGPYRFLGNCEGAFVAWELARQLTAAGEVVEFVGILDTPNPQAFTEKPLTAQLKNRLRTLPLRQLWRTLPSLLLRGLRWWQRRQQAETSGDVSVNRPGTHMGWAFHPQPYDGQVCLFRCTQPGSSDFQDLEIDPLHGWDTPATGGLQLASVPISRDDLFIPSTGRRLATEIEAALQRSVLLGSTSER